MVFSGGGVLATPNHGAQRDEERDAATDKAGDVVGLFEGRHDDEDQIVYNDTHTQREHGEP